MRFENQQSPFLENGIQWAWSATTLDAWKKCPQYYKYTVIDGLRSNNDSVHLKFGGHYASAIEQFYKLVTAGEDREAALVTVIHDTLKATWEYIPLEGSDPVNPAITGRPWISNHAKNRDTLIRSIIWYVDHWEHDNAAIVMLSNGRPALELSAQVEIDTDLTFVAHLDRVVEYSGDIYVMDQKTTGSTVGTYYFDQWSPNNQMSLYSILGKVAFDVPVKGVMIDAAQIAVGFTRFERGFAPRTQGQLDEWLAEAVGWVRDAQRATLEERFPHNDTSCMNYGGCAFRNICNKDPSVRKQFLKTDFHIGTYNPLEIR